MEPNGATNSNVWIVNQSSHDFSAAKRWGTLRFISQGWINRFAVASMHRAFNKALDESQPCDYLLVTSLTIMNIVAATILATKHGRLNLLLYHNDRYIVRKLLCGNTTQEQECLIEEEELDVS